MDRARALRSERHLGTPVARPGEFVPVSIGPLDVWPPVVLAPMAGVTNAPFRDLCRRFGAGLYVGQMTTARAIVERHQGTLELCEFAPGESPRSIQLYGTDPTTMAEATRWLVGEGRIDHLDINFGCPAKKVTRHGGGAALPARPGLLRNVIRATVAAAGDVPVTVKFRMGLTDDWRTDLETARIAEDEGCAAVALHARTAEQRYSGVARWDAIGALKAGVATIPVLGNGDIWEPWDALAMMRETGCDGVVVGRGCLGRPWLFRQLADVFDGNEPAAPPRLAEVTHTMIEHARRLVEWMGPHRGIRDFRKHTGWYLQGFAVGSAVRRDLNQVEGVDQLAGILARLDGEQPFPPQALRMARGHTTGPTEVVLPHGFGDGPDDEALAPEAGALVSGG